MREKVDKNTDKNGQTKLKQTIIAQPEGSGQ